MWTEVNNIYLMDNIVTLLLWYTGCIVQFKNLLLFFKLFSMSILVSNGWKGCSNNDILGYDNKKVLQQCCYKMRFSILKRPLTDWTANRFWYLNFKMIWMSKMIWKCIEPSTTTKGSYKRWKTNREGGKQKESICIAQNTGNRKARTVFFWRSREKTHFIFVQR